LTSVLATRSEVAYPCQGRHGSGKSERGKAEKDYVTYFLYSDPFGKAIADLGMDAALQSGPQSDPELHETARPAIQRPCLMTLACQALKARPDLGVFFRKTGGALGQFRSHISSS
jgi:hypothetical protein